MHSDHQAEIETIIHTYFEGLHFANITKLKSVFTEDCVLKAPGIRRDLNSWFELVASRPVPAQINATFDYKILHLEILGQQAMVKVSCPLLGNDYVDFLGLLFENEQWRIVNKMYANRPETLINSDINEPIHPIEGA